MSGFRGFCGCRLLGRPRAGGGHGFGGGDLKYFEVFKQDFQTFFIMNDYINGGNRPQVKRSSKLPVHIRKTGGIRQPPKTSLKLSSHDGDSSRDPQSANQDLSKYQIPENCVLLKRSEDKENNEHTTLVESGNTQHGYMD